MEHDKEFGGRTSSPWGHIQTRETLAPGIVAVTTASHGGIWLSWSRHKQVKERFGPTFAGGPWYEEDCDWARVAVTFPEAFTADAVAAAEATIRAEQKYAAEQAAKQAAKTELTETGEQYVMPGCERHVTTPGVQLGLWE